jgi:Domain of unknown function (DUF4159)
VKTILISLVLCTGVLWAFQKPFRQYPGMEYEEFSLPPDYQAKAEFVFARLMYPDRARGFGRFGGFGGFGRFGNWREGHTSWTNDYPRADRHLLVALRRLTRLSARSVEQPVNLEDGDDVYNWPFLYVVRAGNWELTDEQIPKLRDFIRRGGFLVCDDIWGEREWEGFVATMSRVLPRGEILDLQDSDPAFHTVFDLDHRYQISGQWSLRSGVPYLNGGVVPHWRGIYDDQKRLVVAIWVNNDTGDSWEWADDPAYPERYSALGIRMVVNHVIYAMTH